MEEVVTKIDPSLTFRGELKPSPLLVYEVEKEGSIYVLKVARVWSRWAADHLEQEAEILRLADGVDGITHLVQTYGDIAGYRNPILKEFHEGQNISKLRIKIQDTNVQRKLENTIRDLHCLGIAGIEVKGKNIVVSPDGGEGKIIDLGSGVIYHKFLNYIPFTKFGQMRSQDLRDLELLFE